MKFLILTKSRDVAPPLDDPIAAREAAREAFAAALRDGSVDCAYQFASGRRAVTIANADKAEEIWDALMSYPLSSQQEYEVHPLVDLDYVFQRTTERIKKAAGA